MAESHAYLAKLELDKVTEHAQLARKAALEYEYHILAGDPTAGAAAVTAQLVMAAQRLCALAGPAGSGSGRGT